MKTIYRSLVALFIPLVSSGMFAAIPSLFPEWNATVVVIDEVGNAVSDADVVVGYYVPSRAEQEISMGKKVGKTWTNGVFKAVGPQSLDLFIQATKTNCYTSSKKVELGPAYQYDAVKWSPTVTLVLKKIVEPIAMYAKWVDVDPPNSRTRVGYDVFVGDWIAPYGKGAQADIFFFQSLRKRSESDFDYRLEVSFPNPGDGIQPFETSPEDRASALRSPHEAPKDGYKSEWTKARAHHPGYANSGGLNDDASFFIRVRTVLDEHGNVKSAHYGKIYGDFMNFRYYVNPTVNSRNIEFDPTKNLLKSSLPSQRVKMP